MSELLNAERIFKSRTHILYALGKQGYNVQDYAEISQAELIALIKNDQLDMLVTNLENNTKIYIKYELNTVLNPKKINDMIQDLFHDDEKILTEKDNLFIIAKATANETLTKELMHIWAKEKINIVIESLEQLQFSILDHSLVPEHIPLTLEETAIILDKYNISTTSQLPEISRFDPVARVMVLRPGIVCRIIRPSKTAVQSNYYRVCVNV